MTSRYGGSSVTNRERNSLFSNYDSQDRTASRSPAVSSNRYATPDPHGGFSAYPNSTSQNDGFRAATPNSRGGYNTAVLESLESQEDEHITGILGKVGRLKDLTLRIGEEIRDSTDLAATMNDQFSTTGQRLKGTMGRMLRMAESTGVGWRVWLGFFAVVVLLFWYVWLF